MKLSGWIFMFISWSVILGTFIYCMYRTLKSDEPRQTDQTPENNHTG